MTSLFVLDLPSSPVGLSSPALASVESSGTVLLFSSFSSSVNPSADDDVRLPYEVYRVLLALLATDGGFKGTAMTSSSSFFCSPK